MKEIYMPNSDRENTGGAQVNTRDLSCTSGICQNKLKVKISSHFEHDICYSILS